MFKVLKNIKNIKLKVLSILMLITLMSLQLSPFMLKATASQLQFHSPGLITPATDIAYGKNVFFTNGTLGGDTAYCVDYGKSLPSGTLSYYKQLSAQGVSILVYGYPHSSAASMGCASDDEAYMATQLALWNVLTKTGESEGTRTFNLDNIYAKPGYEEFMQRAAAAAIKLSARAVADPYIPNPSLTLDTSSAKLVNVNGMIVTGPYIANATGGTVSSIKASLSNAPSTARIVDANGNEKTTFANGDAIYVRFSEAEEGSTMTLKVVADTNKVVGSIYAGDSAAQHFVKLDTLPVELTATVNIKWGTQKGTIEVLKVDQNENPVSGVRFELRDSSNVKIAEGTTGSDGYIRFTNVKAGTYKLIEVAAPEGYIMGDKPLEFTVTAGQTFKAKVVNNKITGSLEIHKVDETGKAIPNVTFEILNGSKERIAEVTTDENGRAKVSNLSVGTYYYREIKAPVNVVMDKTLYEFNITKTNTAVVKTITNEKVKGSLKIIKIDENQNPLAGVKFQILDANKKVIDTITTNASGIAVSKELTPGTYYYKEIEVPSNIVVDSAEYPFVIQSAGQIITKEIVNKFAKGSLKIVKVDENQNPLAGVKFQILDVNKNVVDTITTDVNGIAQSRELMLGAYYYKEIEAPSNVVIDRTEYPFELTRNSQVVTKAVVNQLVKGALSIIKIDEKRTPIAGVRFQILDANKKVVDTIVTDNEGKATSNKLDVGTYYYKEVSAPFNIVIDSKEYPFSLTETTPAITKTVVNKLAKGRLQIVKVDENNIPLVGVTFNILDSSKNVVDTITTNEQGKAVSKNLPLGIYYYQEIEAPSNVVIDANIYEFKLSSNAQVITKTVINRLAKGSLRIQKVNQNNTPIEGVKFQILDANKNIVTTITTDANGIATVDNLLLGTYYYQEMEAPENVVIDKNEYKFALTQNEQVISKRVVNQIISGSLQIIKVDETNTPLAGVTFNILDVNKNVVEQIITDVNGIALSSDLKPGTYYYQEINAPENVIIDSTLYKFNVNESNQLISKKVVNRLAKGLLKIIKVDENNIPLAGVMFNILDANQNIIDTITTDVNGIAVSKELEKGTYYYQEIEAPSGIIIDENRYEFKVEKDNEVVIKNMINYYEKGHLEIIKKDGNGNLLAGVTFHILDANKNVVDTVITNEEGKAISKELALGTYYYQEISAPSNVVVDDTVYEFKITEANKVITKTVVNQLKYGALRIIKVDENDQPLAGVTFNILDSHKNVVDTIVTDANGIATSRDLTIGTYYYQEVSAPKGIVIDPNMYEFKIEEDKDMIIKNIVNNYTKGTLQIIKVDEENQPIEGVVFNILDKNKNIVDTIITNKEGKATSKNLSFGTYYYQEKEVPETYVIDHKEYAFQISTPNEIITKTVVNKFAEGKLRIIKVDENDQPLAGVQFNILDADKKVIDTIVTNEQGIAESKDLKLGTYYYQEIKAPDGIVVDDTIYEFTIAKNGEVVIKNMINYYAKGNLEIVKVDTSNQPIEGVKFQILDINKNVVDTIVTDKEGKATSKALIYGVYYYQEIEAPAKYIMDQQMHEFRITENKQVISKVVINAEKYGSIKILKLDKETNAVLAGAKFDIINSEGRVVDTIVTDSNGIAISKALPLGNYTYHEVEAPNGYIKEDTTYEFGIQDHEQVIEMTVYNQKDRIPVTGGMLSNDIMIILIITMVSIFGYIVMNTLANAKEENN